MEYTDKEIRELCNLLDFVGGLSVLRDCLSYWG